MPKVTWTSDIQQVLNDLQKQKKATEEQLALNKKLVDEDKKRENQAKRLLREQESGQERVNRKLKEADELLKKGNLTTEEHARVTERLRGKLDQTFGQQLRTQLQQTLTQYVGIQAAVSGVTKVVNELTAAYERQRQSAIGATGDFRELGQLEGGAALREEALRFRAAGGALSKDEAARAIFALASSPFDEETKSLFKRLGEEGIIKDIPSAVEAAGGLRISFGEQETGTGRDILRKAIVAAGPGRSSVQELIQGVAEAGGAAAEFGLSDEELFAAVDIVSRTYGVRRGSTYVRSLLQQLNLNPRFQGLSLSQAIGEVSALGTTPQELQKIIPNIEGQSAFFNLRRNLALYGQALENIGAAQTQPVVEERIRQQQQDPLAQFATQTLRAEGIADVAAFREGAAAGRGGVLERRALVGEAFEGGGFFKALARLSQRFTDFQEDVGFGFQPEKGVLRILEDTLIEQRKANQSRPVAVPGVEN